MDTATDRLTATSRTSAGSTACCPQLRTRYPDLQIENVSGGGNRLDVGMLRYTDVAWMDDRTAPSAHVRHNIEGLSAVFPPAYLLSFVTDHDGEPLHDAPDLSLYFRSRMVGALGLCFRTADFREGESASIAHEIAIYKTMRETLSSASGALLTRAGPGDRRTGVGRPAGGRAGQSPVAPQRVPDRPERAQDQHQADGARRIDPVPGAIGGHRRARDRHGRRPDGQRRRRPAIPQHRGAHPRSSEPRTGSSFFLLTNGRGFLDSSSVLCH